MEEYDDPAKYMVTELEKKLLLSLVFEADLEEWEQDEFIREINRVVDYKVFQQLEYRLEARMKNIQDIPNPNQRDINRHLRKIRWIR